AGQIDNMLYGVTANNILDGEKAGFFNLRGFEEARHVGVAPGSFGAAIGQAVGATAAYLAFFKTSADRVDIRKLQTELMTYQARILPYQDIMVDDAHFYAIQRFGLAGVLANLNKETDFYFGKEERVSFEEVEPVF